MKISAISDIHVKNPRDSADYLLGTFLDHPLVQSSDYIILLGDIFDLMCGPHQEYLRLFQHHFDKMEYLAKAGKKVYFFEGNHDVHLQKLFHLRWKKDEVRVFQNELIEEIDGKKYYFSHGDEHEIDNIAYQRYKKFILSPPLRFIANRIMPYSLLNFIGERASKVSRKKGFKAFDEELVKNRFRHGVLQKTKGHYDFVLGGHSHVQDIFQMSESLSTYVNNGYALKTKTFIFIENNDLKFIPLV